MATPKTNIIIIGAGIYGLAAAKTYLEINPNTSVRIIDEDSSIGGVWSASRVYSGLVADLPTPVFEFSDLDMMEEFGMEKWADIPGEYMHEYLERYAKKFGLTRRCLFNLRVVHVERDARYGWSVETRSMVDVPSANVSVGDTALWYCDALIVATGLTSKPVFPDIDMATFGGLVLHSKDLHKRQDELVSDNIQSVVVVGGNKSSVEAVNICASAGKEVNWLIREDGAGPGMLLNAKLANGRSGQEVALRRVTTFNNPTIFRHRGWWDLFFLSGKNSLGTRLFNWFWTKVAVTGFGDRYEKSEDGMLLKPDVPNIFWSPSGLGIAHDTTVNLLRIVDEGKLVHVSRTSIKSISGQKICLSNRSEIRADAIIFATGWEPSSNLIFNNTLKAELGLQRPVDSLGETEVKHWNGLDSTADKEVLDAYPMLAKPPKIVVRKHTLTPFRLLRTIIPPKLAAQNDRNIVFLGQLANIRHCFLAETSSLWSIAYLEGLLPDKTLISDEEVMNKEIALANAFMKRRYPGRKNYPIAAMEIQDWIDIMLKDLGLRTDRNRLMWERDPSRGWSWFGWRPWWREWFTCYEPNVYRGIVTEFLESLKKDEEKKFQ